MPRVVKMYEKSKGSLAHNQGPVGPTRVAMGPRPPKPRPAGGCRARCNAKYEIGSAEWEACMKRCQAGGTIG